MDNNMNTGAPLEGAAPQPQGDQQGKSGLKMGSKTTAIIAVVVLFLIILVAAMANSGESKAKKAVKTYVKVFFSGDKKPRDVKWSKYYPKDLEGDVEDWAEDFYDYMKDAKMLDDVEHLKILSVAKVKGKDMKEILEDTVESYYVNGRFFDLEKKDVRDLKVSAGYIVTAQMEYDGDMYAYSFVVIKVDGRYGVYSNGALLYPIKN